MPFILLVVVACVAGALVALATARLHRPAALPPVDRAPSRLRDRLAPRLDREQATGLALTVAVVVVLAGGVVLAVLAVVVRSTDALSGIDSAVARWGDRHATGGSTQGLKLVTDLGETWLVVLAAVLVAAVELRRRGDRRVVPFLVLVIGGDKLVTTLVKTLIDRARPTLNPVAETLGPSFPSGHSSTAAAFWAAAALVAGRWCARRARPALAGAAAGIAVAVAASRVLLDVHWLTDVLGGLALGWAWFAVCAVAFGGRLLRPGGAPEVRPASGPPPAARPAWPPRAGSPRRRPPTHTPDR
ncbi:phosphatase PAP2 family protein [Baekduia soli]|uniref:Phosphatase PAP2 family protein n=1 Tax=Baekduia soli TaxID=496014 RepID=A0A5B8U0K2_9ACTN|nr:phosphatase PAP2 family protein [Baekduia soli]QEC46506.1 phosphatase PAP2 family protein [Baekduia soli]